MTILVCGSEGDWSLFGNTLDSRGDDDKRRGSVQLEVGDQMFKSFTPSDDIWVHVRMAAQVNDTLFAQPAIPSLVVRDSNANVLFEMIDDSSVTEELTNFFNIRYRTSVAGAVTTDPEDFPYGADQFNNYDVRIVRSTTTVTNDTLTYYFYRNEVLRFTTEVIDAAGWGQVGQIVLQSKSFSTANDSTYYQDVIVTDGIPTVGMELATLVPSAVGNYSDFTNDYTNIDDFGYDQSTVISADATGQRESWIFATPTFDLGDKVIYGVVINTVAQTDVGAVIADFQPFLRMVGVDYNSAAPLGANNTAPDSYVTVYTQNPSTAQPWQQGELAGLEAGLLTI